MSVSKESMTLPEELLSYAQFTGISFERTLFLWKLAAFVEQEVQSACRPNWARIAEAAERLQRGFLTRLELGDVKEYKKARKQFDAVHHGGSHGGH